VETAVDEVAEHDLPHSVLRIHPTDLFVNHPVSFLAFSAAVEGDAASGALLGALRLTALEADFALG
jgi:hypothetical protein